jgi:hypothetical protein
VRTLITRRLSAKTQKIDTRLVQECIRNARSKRNRCDYRGARRSLRDAQIYWHQGINIRIPENEPNELYILEMNKFVNLAEKSVAAGSRLAASHHLEAARILWRNVRDPKPPSPNISDRNVRYLKRARNTDDQSYSTVIPTKEFICQICLGNITEECYLHSCGNKLCFECRPLCESCPFCRGKT